MQGNSLAAISSMSACYCLQRTVLGTIIRNTSAKTNACRSRNISLVYCTAWQYSYLERSARLRAFRAGVGLLGVNSCAGGGVDGTAAGDAARTGPCASGAIFVPVCSSRHTEQNGTQP
jgi:hypothetical protein